MDALVLPSLRRCGGAVVLEAMAMEKAVIAPNRCGLADYIDASCGILIELESRNGPVENLAKAMTLMATSPSECFATGKAGHAKVNQEYDWEIKVDRMLEIYLKATNRSGRLVNSA